MFKDWYQRYFGTLSANVPRGAVRRPRDLIIGLDFGTAYSKAVIRDVELGESYAVPFRDDQNPYLAQSNTTGNGSVKLDFREVIDSQRSDPLRTAVGEAVQRRLAELVREARTWFEREHGSRFAEFRMVWHVHLGVPVTMEGFEDSRTNRAFYGALRSAWHHAYPEEPIEPEEERLAVYPELGAEITTYIQSNFYQDDLHLLVDIGAGSVDVATFCLSGRERAVIMVSKLSWSGAEMLQQSEDKGRTLQLANDDWYSVLCRTKKEIYPRSPAWRRPFRVFWCGGGTALPEYRARLENLDEWCLGNWSGWRNFDVQVPQPPLDMNAPDLPDGEYHRLSVAHGLSYQIEELAEFRGPPPGVDPAPIRDVGDRFIDKDQV